MMSYPKEILDLIDVAREIDTLAKKKEERAKAWQQLSNDVRKGLSREEINKRKFILDSVVVVDFSTAIARLQEVLKRMK